MSKKTEPKSFKILRFVNFVQVASPKQIYQVIYAPLNIAKEVLKADLEKLLRRKELAFHSLSVPGQQVLICTLEGAHRGAISWKKPPEDLRALKRGLAWTELNSLLMQKGYRAEGYPTWGQGQRVYTCRPQKKLALELFGPIPGDWQIFINRQDEKILVARYPTRQHLEYFAQKAEDTDYRLLALVDKKRVLNRAGIKVLSTQEIMIGETSLDSLWMN